MQNNTMPYLIQTQPSKLLKIPQKQTADPQPQYFFSANFSSTPFLILPNVFFANNSNG